MPAAGEQPEKVSEKDFLFLVIGPTALPASVTEIGLSATVKSALFPPLIVQVVSVMAPVKLMMPPAALFSAKAVGAATAAAMIATENIFFIMR
ncbi:hypothetical protein AK51_06425 [Serratia nematodiphila DZ0503SBS1]|nr:hypothetical protein AK51_06425 [Serratia nematodiphila DZ0503SBS1]